MLEVVDADGVDGHRAQFFQLAAFLGVDHAAAHAFVELGFEIERAQVAVLHGLLELALHRLGQHDFGEVAVDAAGRVVGAGRGEHAVGQAVAGFVRAHQQGGDAAAQAVGRRGGAAAEREHQQPQGPADRTDREVAQRGRQRRLHLVHGIDHRIRHQRLVGDRTALVFVTLEDGADDVQLAEHVAQAAGQLLLELQLAAQGQHRHIGAQRQRRRVAVELAVETLGVGIARGGAEGGVGHAEPQAAHGVGDGGADVPEQQVVEVAQALGAVGVGGRLHFLQHERVAQNRALAEDHQRAGHDVGALDRDRDRRGLPGAAQVVLRAEDDALAAVHVHGVADQLARHLGAVVLGDGGRHRRQFAAPHRRGRGFRQRADGVGVAGDAAQRLFDAFEAADRQAELLADAGVGAGDHRAHLAAAGGGGGQGDRAADRQAFDQHLPALAGHFFAADQLRQRNEDLFAAHRAVLERGIQRHRAAAHFHAGGVARQQGQGDADVGLVAEQLVRVVHAERQADQAGHRRQGDVALVEGELDAQHVGAVPLALADHAVVGDRGGVGAGPRAGQAEAGHFTAIGQTRQVVVLLLLGAVMHQQFARAQRVRHADRGRHHRGHRGQLLDDLVVGQRREAQAAVFLRNDQAEEFVLLDEVPQLGLQVGVHVGDFPVVHHRAQFFDRTVQEGLLLGGQGRLGLAQQLVPVRFAGEQLAFETHGAGLQRGALGGRQRRQDLGVEAQERRGDQVTADRGDQQRQHHQGQHGGGHRHRARIGAEQAAGHQGGAGQRREHGEGITVVADEGGNQQDGQPRGDDAHNAFSGTIRVRCGAACGYRHHTLKYRQAGVGLSIRTRMESSRTLSCH